MFRKKSKWRLKMTNLIQHNIIVKLLTECNIPFDVPSTKRTRRCWTIASLKRYTKACRNTWKMKMGSNHVKTYPYEFDYKLKSKIKDRDNNSCRSCFSEQYLHVHHIDYVKSNIDEDNLITLCNRCHGKIPHHKKPYMGQILGIIFLIPIS